MKAIVKESWRADAPLVLRDVSTRAPRPWEVRVAVKAASVNPADWKMLTSATSGLGRRLLSPLRPLSAGIDFSGVVEAVGSRVKKVKIGDPVAGISLGVLGMQGSYAESVLVPALMVSPLPEGLDIITAGALPVAGYTAWHAVKDLGKLREGQRALILGASGGVGHLAVQIAHHVCGGYTVGVCSGKNARLVRDLGADEVIDYTRGDPLQQAKAFGPYQVVVDCVGSYPGSKCRALLGKGGRYVNVSPDNWKNMLQLAGSPRQTRTLLGAPTGTQLAPVIEAVASERIKVIIAEKFPLANIQDAFARSQTGRVVGKLVLVP